MRILTATTLLGVVTLAGLLPRTRRRERRSRTSSYSLSTVKGSISPVSLIDQPNWGIPDLCEPPRCELILDGEVLAIDEEVRGQLLGPEVW